jgi:UDP-N-acetylmuramyl pentapeptide phosphotransferase/UDP-N-acetylglucosamine-1-phosphate transferase
MIYLSVFLIAFILSLFLMPAATKAGEKLNILSKPKDGVKGKPCLGGIAIYISFMSALAVAYFSKPGIYVNLYGLVVSSAIIAASDWSMT